MADPTRRSNDVEIELDDHKKQDFITAAPDERAANAPLPPRKSKGVLKMELLMSRLSTKYLVLLYAAFTVTAFVQLLGERLLRLLERLVGSLSVLSFFRSIHLIDLPSPGHLVSSR